MAPKKNRCNVKCISKWYSSMLFKILKQKLKILKKMKRNPMFMDRIIKMLRVPKEIYRFNAIPN